MDSAQAARHEASAPDSAAGQAAAPSAVQLVAAEHRAADASMPVADAVRQSSLPAIDSDDEFGTFDYCTAKAKALDHALSVEAEIMSDTALTPVQQQIDESLLGANDLAKQGHVMGLLASCTPTELNDCLLADGMVDRLLGRLAHKDASPTRAALLSMFGRVRCAALSIAARAVVIVALQRQRMDEQAARCVVELVLSTHGSHLACAIRPHLCAAPWSRVGGLKL
jgi:hypothetical protein